MAQSKLTTYISKVNLFAGSVRTKFNSITEIIGSLASLNTTAKTSIVAAINEIKGSLGSYIATTQKGVANGVASLDGAGKVPSTQLPSYVDDVLEGTKTSSTVFKNADDVAFPNESGKIYIDTSTGKTYRWSGTIFVEGSETIALGETSSTAYRGDRGKVAYDHTSSNNNPHSVTKAQVGLSSVSNYGMSTKAEAEARTSNVKYMTPLRTNEQIDSVVGTTDPNDIFLTGLN